MEFNLQPVGKNYHTHSGLLIEGGQARIDGVLCIEIEHDELLFVRIKNIFSVKARRIQLNQPRPAPQMFVFAQLVVLECSETEDKDTGKKHLKSTNGIIFAFSDDIIRCARIVRTRKHPSEDSTSLILAIQE